MVMETTVAKKRVLFRDKCYFLTYRLITHAPNRHQIEILCKCNRETEREKAFFLGTKHQAYKIVKLFAEESVFPIALKETLENYL
ncbi:MAG: hypothetical protein IJ278_02650 [Clostridia bacterium]|nr:hypothetical protein [Clostridia bacterium]